MEALHYLVCYCYGHTRTDRKGHVFQGIDHDAQTEQKTNKKRMLTKVLNYNSKLKQADIELSHILPSILSCYLQQHE